MQKRRTNIMKEKKEKRHETVDGFKKLYFEKPLNNP